MNSNIRKLGVIAQKKERSIIGLMSGTSLDGLDIAWCKIKGCSKNTELRVAKFQYYPYTDQQKKILRDLCFRENVSLPSLSWTNRLVAEWYADFVVIFLKEHNIPSEEVDLLASHGQTIYHHYSELRQEEGHTLQIGDGDIIACRTRIITLSDFRQKNIAAGGQGAPLAPYGESLLIKSSTPTVLLNIGGIANFSYFKGGFVVASDSGPGNCLSDALVRKYFPGQYFDHYGEYAAQGKVNIDLLESLKKHPFFKKPIPKSTGPEEFNTLWCETILSNYKHLSVKDLISTVNQLTADSIVEEISKLVESQFDLYISGGGKHNTTLVNRILEKLPRANYIQEDFAGIPSDAKEAVIFALIANESICGPSWKELGFDHHLSMGKISFPD